jgi:hypothetical protein
LARKSGHPRDLLARYRKSDAGKMMRIIKATGAMEEIRFALYWDKMPGEPAAATKIRSV